MNDKKQLDAAFHAFTELVGADRASRDPERVERYSRSNVFGSTSAAGVVRPRDREQAIGVVRIAAAHGVPLYPVSRGQNWGYGAMCPVGPGQVVVDLRDLDRILEVNTELGYAVLEPGVTPRQLFRHLTERDLPVWMDCTDSTPDTSVLGNVMDRGMGFTPYGDRFGNTCALEVVLADGTLVKTGFSHYADARVKHLHKWGIGPAIDGLFTQSSLGMVLSGTVWLLRRPEAFKVLFAVTRDGEMERLVDAIRELKLAGVLPSAIHINPSRWPSPHAPEGSWMAMAGIYGPKRFVDASCEVAVEALGQLGTVLLTDPREGPLAPHAGEILRAFGLPDVRDEATTKLADKIVARLQMFADLHRGAPFSEDVILITPHPSIEDAALPSHGHYTYGPTCPATGRDAAELVAYLKTVVTSHGFRTSGPSFAFINPRTLVSVAHLVFDRQEADSIRRAKECIDAIVRGCIERGFPPYRVGIQSMDAIDPEGSGYWSTVRKLKEALDPNGIFAPGRYLPPPPKR